MRFLLDSDDMRRAFHRELLAHHHYSSPYHQLACLSSAMLERCMERRLHMDSEVRSLCHHVFFLTKTLQVVHWRETTDLFSKNKKGKVPLEGMTLKKHLL